MHRPQIQRNREAAIRGMAPRRNIPMPSRFDVVRNEPKPAYPVNLVPKRAEPGRGSRRDGRRGPDAGGAHERGCDTSSLKG
jgi:hypothetical protein